MSNCRVIALTNQKGGVGKTTTALNLGIGLANTGKRVLLIDSDPQGSLTAALGWKNSDGLEVTLSSIYGMLLDDKLPKTPSYGILHSREGVDLLPCDIMLSGTEMALMSSMCRESHLKRYIEFVKDGYDYILIDC
ncbi:MAG: ParA family protein, partial [Ruminococcus sp.]